MLHQRPVNQTFSLMPQKKASLSSLAIFHQQVVCTGFRMRYSVLWDNTTVNPDVVVGIAELSLAWTREMKWLYTVSITWLFV